MILRTSFTRCLKNAFPAAIRRLVRSLTELSRRLRQAGCFATHAVRRAAVFGEESDQRIHLRIVCGVEDESALLPSHNQARMRQFLQMEGDGGGRYVQRAPYFAGRDACWPCLDEKAEDGQPPRVRHGGEKRYSFRVFHSSTIMEM